MENRRYTARIDTDLLEYLKRRADQYYRRPEGELNAILRQLKDDEERETELAEKVAASFPS